MPYFVRNFIKGRVAIDLVGRRFKKRVLVFGGAGGD
jgi:hypothetical protein